MSKKRWAIPIQGDATRADSVAMTPSPDAEGKVRLRDPGLGIGDVGDPAFTVSATSPGIVASGPTEQEGGDALPPKTHASFFSGVGGLQSTLGLNVPDGKPSPSPRSTPTQAPSSRNGGPASPTSEISSLSPTLRVGGRASGAGSSYDNTPTVLTGAIQPGAKGWRGMRGDGSDPLIFDPTAGSHEPIAFPVTYSGFQNVPTDGVAESLRTENYLAVMTGSPPPSGQAGSPARISASQGSGEASALTIKVVRATGDFGDPKFQVDDLPMLAANPMSDRQMMVLTTASPDQTQTDSDSTDPTCPAPASPSPSSTLWPDTDPRLSSWRTSLASSPVMEGETWRRSSVRWSTSGMASLGGCSTLATSECPSVDGESSSLACEAVPTTLTDILQPSAPPRFSLSARAAAGILRRASKRGRALPTELESALTSLAHLTPPSGTTGPGGPTSPSQPGTSASVRRLTPVECERLMGWPDGHTIVRGWSKAGSSRTETPRPTRRSSPSSSTPVTARTETPDDQTGTRVRRGGRER